MYFFIFCCLRGTTAPFPSPSSFAHCSSACICRAIPTMYPKHAVAQQQRPQWNRTRVLKRYETGTTWRCLMMDACMMPFDVLPFDVPISDDYTSLHTCFNTTEINTGKFVYHKSSALAKIFQNEVTSTRTCFFLVGYPVDDPFIPIHSFHTVDSSEIRRAPPGMYETL